MKSMYGKFALVLVISWVVMFLLSMSLIRAMGHFQLSASNMWMALIMVTGMGLVMMLVMRSMFEDQRRNMMWLAALGVLFVGSFFLGRAETFVGNAGFLRSMIPHHSRAILMCQEATITDGEIKDLCGQIIEAQQNEILQMERMLEDRY